MFLALFARRWEQLVSPQVWSEDGTVILPQLLAGGPATVVWPVNGYLVVIPRLISWAALSVSPSWYPLIGTLLTWAFIVAVGVAIAVSPLVVRGGVLLALAAFFVPSDAEVFGIPLYTFWWAGLLVVLAALWRPDARGVAWRVAFVTAGGLSSPLIFLALPLFAYRAFTFRDRPAERAVAAVAAATALIQAAVVLHEHIHGAQAAPSLAGAVIVAPAKFLGSYVLGDIARAAPAAAEPVLLAGAIATIVLVALAVRGVRGGRRTLAFLIYLWIGSIALTMARVDVSAIDPVSAGPRYFYYPFVLEGWFLVHVMRAARQRALRAACAAALALGFITVVPILSRSHDDLAWRANLSSCASMPAAMVYELPVETDGHAASAWWLPLSGERCSALLAADGLRRAIPLADPPISPYAARRITISSLDRSSLAPLSAIVSNGWNGTDFARSSVPGLAVIGSYRASDADTGSIVLRLHRGDRLLFRVGPMRDHQRLAIEVPDGTQFARQLPPATDWTALDFASLRLPPVFTATFADEGTGWGEWSALALRPAPAQPSPAGRASVRK